MKLSHPGGTGLNDLESHVLFVPVSVGHANDIARFQVGRFYKSQGGFFVTVGQDTIQMVFDHMGKLMIRLKSAPLELLHPVAKEFSGPCPGRVGPEVIERFLEQMGLKKPAVEAQQHIERFPSLTTHMSPSGQENEFLPCQKSLKTPSGLAQLLFSDIIQGLQQVLSDVEFVINNLHIRTLSKEAVFEGLPHVHDRMGDTPSAILPKPLPELRQIPFFSTFSYEQKLWSPRPLQGADQVPIGLPLAYSNLIDAKNRDPIQGPRGLCSLQGKFIDGLHRPPMQGLKYRYRLNRHYLTQFRYQQGQELTDPGTFCNKRQGLQGQSTVWAMDPVVPHSKESQELPQRQMLNLDHPTGMGLFYAPMAFPTFEVMASSLQLQYYRFPAFSFFNAHPSNPIPLYPKQLCETIRTHLVESPFCLFTGKRWENILPDASIFTTKLHNNAS